MGLRHLGGVAVVAGARGAAAGAEAGLGGQRRVAASGALSSAAARQGRHRAHELLLRLPQLSEVRVLQSLTSQDPLVRVVFDQLLHQLDEVGVRVRDQPLDAGAPLLREVEVHVRGVPLELSGEELRRRRAKDIVDLLDLVHLVLTWEQWEERDDLEAHATGREQVHLEIVITIRKQALRGAVPTGTDVLGEGLPRVDAAAAAQVGELDLVVAEEQVLGFHVPVEDAVPVHVVQGLEHLIHVMLHLLLREVMAPPLDCLVHVHVHELEDEGQAACGLVIQHLMQLDDVRVAGQAPERLNLAQIVHLVDAVEVVLHALDGHMFPRLDGLRLQDL
mmetsp:Transcript_111919/g.321526  ORF Transcript_111919/g.321526 Transcript_111919/m.321526 type:complete len:333 (-) Transcript_111919:212-1210(-)